MTRAGRTRRAHSLSTPARSPTRPSVGLGVKILVLGSGAREHAIILALRSEDRPHEIFAAPGNAGIAQDAEIVTLDANDPPPSRSTRSPPPSISW